MSEINGIIAALKVVAKDARSRSSLLMPKRLLPFLEANKLALSARKTNGAADASEITIEAEFAAVTEPRSKTRRLLKQLPFFGG